MEVKKEMTRDTRGGIRILAVTPEMGKVMFKKSIAISAREQKNPDP
jgi:hypothetical protein